MRGNSVRMPLFGVCLAYVLSHMVARSHAARLLEQMPAIRAAADSCASGYSEGEAQEANPDA